MRNKIKIVVLVCLALFSYMNISHASTTMAAAQKSKFLLILGPSGVGKSTIIHHLKNFNDKFRYVTPMTTRELRPGEKDKISISKSEMDKLYDDQKLLVINEIHGIFYGTPKYLIDESLSNGLFPVLDWPADKIDIMKKSYAGQLFVVYIYPESEDELYSRLSNDARDVNGNRFIAGKKELNNFYNGSYDKYIDLKVMNRKSNSLDVAKTIYEAYLNSI